VESFGGHGGVVRRIEADSKSEFPNWAEDMNSSTSLLLIYNIQTSRKILQAEKFGSLLYRVPIDSLSEESSALKSLNPANDCTNAAVTSSLPCHKP